jgi:hypothetical protein
MKIQQLKEAFKQFDHKSNYVSHNELASGHINDNFLIETDGDQFFVLQKINHVIFKDVPGLVNNKVSVSKHLLEKLKHLSKSELERRVLCFVSTIDKKAYYLDPNGNYWNMTVYIDDSITFETVFNETIAYEGGKLIGDFLNLTGDFDASQLIEVIPKFHDMSFRFLQFEESLEVATDERLQLAEQCIDLVWSLKEEMHVIQRLKESGQIKIRVTHNDTKISNLLFDTNSKGLCVIDTDTIMPGIVHYDFGDAIRSICNTAAEDEKDLSKVSFNLSYYKAYVRGFLEEVELELTPVAVKHLPLGAKTMIFIMALRFLTDFLNGDVYYKIAYSNHNLDRSKNQFKLIESLTEQFDQMTILSAE